MRMPRNSSSAPGARVPILRLLLAGALGVAGALLISCGSSGKGLIPAANAGPLQSDFELVSQAAQNANGSCTATENAIVKTEQDFNSLPATIDAGLRTRLREGITNLSRRGRESCASSTSTATTAKTATTPTVTTPTTTTATTTTPTVTTPTTTTPTTTTPTTTTPVPGGGTPAPGETPPAGPEGGAGGVGQGGGVGAGGQEGGK
jgi:septal ring-binding cell division protein DamX